MPTYVVYVFGIIFTGITSEKEKESYLNEAEIFEKTQRSMFPPSSPINMSQQEIKEILTTITSSPSTDI